MAAHVENDSPQRLDSIKYAYHKPVSLIQTQTGDLTPCVFWHLCATLKNVGSSTSLKFLSDLHLTSSIRFCK